jgi:hypothetical protein
MDKIVVRTNADMQRVIDWADRLTGVPVKLAFPEAEIAFEEEDILLRFRDEGDSVVWFEAEMAGRKVVEWRSNLETGDIEDLRIAAEGEKKVGMAILLARDNTVAKCVGKFRSLMLFAAYYREEVMASRVVSRVAKPRKNGSPRKGGKRMLTVRRYTIGSEMLSELPRKYERHTESWGVRGHYRNYKNGKTVWVRPYVKGELNKRNDKEYYV